MCKYDYQPSTGVLPSKNDFEFPYAVQSYSSFPTGTALSPAATAPLFSTGCPLIHDLQKTTPSTRQAAKAAKIAEKAAKVEAAAAAKAVAAAAPAGAASQNAIR
jgi:hypothetical protein